MGHHFYPGQGHPISFTLYRLTQLSKMNCVHEFQLLMSNRMEDRISMTLKGKPRSKVMTDSESPGSSSYQCSIVTIGLSCVLQLQLTYPRRQHSANAVSCLARHETAKSICPGDVDSQVNVINFCRLMAGKPMSRYCHRPVCRLSVVCLSVCYMRELWPNGARQTHGYYETLLGSRYLTFRIR